MPSAARQRLSTELWKSPEPPHKSPVPYNNYEIQAHPGFSEFSNDKVYSKTGNPALQKIFRGQLTPKRKNKKNLQRRGSSDDILRDQASSMGHKDSNQTVSASVCSDSECGISYNSTDSGGFFATDSVKAPSANALPLPPSDWLKSFPKRNDKSPVMVKASCQAFLNTLVAAERHL